MRCHGSAWGKGEQDRLIFSGGDSGTGWTWAEAGSRENPEKAFETLSLPHFRGRALPAIIAKVITKTRGDRTTAPAVAFQALVLVPRWYAPPAVEQRFRKKRMDP